MPLFFILFIIIGLLQMAAIFAGLQEWLGFNIVFTIIGAFVAAYIPILGTIAAFGGAIVGWGWEWWQATLLFVAPQALMLLAMLVSRDK